MTADIAAFCIGPGASIRGALDRIDRGGQGIALVIDDGRRLLGTVTDGDVRRAILAGVDLDRPVGDLLGSEAPIPHRRPLTAPVDASKADLLSLMNENSLRHIPLVDRDGRVVDLALLGEMVRENELPLRALIMAGGYGTRLRPLTEHLPKPMLPLGDQPLLEWTIRQLEQAGIRHVSLATHYKRDVIARHFGDGRDLGVDIHYVEEEHPLGTAGALGLLDATDDPLLVLNGDILTQVDYRAMLDFHREHQADMTVAVRRQEMQVPYGVVEMNGLAISGISEKPVVRHFINAGIYLVGPGLGQHIPRGQRYDMPDLIQWAIEEGLRVIGFPVQEYWLDVGKMEDYQKALADFQEGVV